MQRARLLTAAAACAIVESGLLHAHPSSPVDRDRRSGDPSNKAQDSVVEIRKSAARLLRQRYAASPWTKKAAPFA